ncbi:MAG TPA: DinB family protein [Ktedonobacteraceae bacterium]|nr:DinB family protein [Ktedonobacteraceae bacterium]
MASVENPFDKVRRKMVTARIEFMGQLAKFSANELTQPPVDSNEWTPLQIANHLYIADALALEQIRLVQEEDNPLIVETEEETPRLTRAAPPPTSLDSVLAGMAARREAVFEYLSQLPDDAWERPFRHPTWGERKFYQLVNVLPLHDQIHARQLADIKAANGNS